jgi:hypothetical protein
LRDELNCSFWASGDTFAAFATLIGTNGVGRHAPVRSGAQLSKDAERAEVLDVHSTHLEYVVRTHHDALSFGFAAPMVDDRSRCHVLTSLRQRSGRTTSA